MWKPQIYQNTRSRAKQGDNETTILTPWILEPLFLEDMIMYEIGREAFRNLARTTRQELTGLGTVLKMVGLVRKGGVEIGSSTKIKTATTIQRCDRTGIVIDIAGYTGDMPIIITPWALSAVGKEEYRVDAHKIGIMKWVESTIGTRCFWVSMRSIREGTPIGSSEMDLRSIPDPILPPQRMFTIMRLILEGSTMQEASREMYPYMKSSYAYVPGVVVSCKQTVGVEKHEISLLPYITTRIRRSCHERGVYDYMDPRFLDMLETEHATGPIASFVIPWVRFMQGGEKKTAEDYYRVLRPDVFAGFRAVVEEDQHEGRESIFIDFETLSGMIYLCGIYVSGTDEFHSIWSSDACAPRAEKHLLEEVYRVVTRCFPDARIYFYHAERSMWKTSCGRHNISLHDPIAQLFDDAIDLCTVLRSSGVLVRHVPNYKLKSVGKGLFQHGKIQIDFPSDGGIENGEDSMTMARRLYGSHHGSGTTVHVIGPPVDATTNEPRRNLWVYNRYDCRVLHAIRDWLVSL